MPVHNIHHIPLPKQGNPHQTPLPKEGIPQPAPVGNQLDGLKTIVLIMLMIVMMLE